jgi:hypothetical protein
MVFRVIRVIRVSRVIWLVRVISYKGYYSDKVFKGYYRGLRIVIVKDY